MISGSLARRYARALLAVAEEAGEIESCGEAIEKIARALATAKGALETLSDRSFPLAERMKAMEEISAKFSPPVLLRNFLFFLVEKGRIGFLTEICREFERMRDEQLGIVRVGVVAAAEPSGPLLSTLEKVLAARLKKKVVATGQADPELIGGLVIKVGHTIYDGSVKRKLTRIQEEMLIST